jgi:transcriptional regulator with XRE-family HTH domain
MREKLLDLMKNEGLKPSQLAEQLEINPAGISHILAGRNKPGFDLLQKILRRFPRINPDWLLLDSDKMYRDEYPAASPGQQASRTTAAQTASPESGNDLFTPTLPGGLRADEKQTQDADGHDGSATLFPPALFGKANVKRVVVLYDDQTFESFTPSTKR